MPNHYSDPGPGCGISYRGEPYTPVFNLPTIPHDLRIHWPNALSTIPHDLRIHWPNA